MKNAPLVEIIAELRWEDGLTTKPPSIFFGMDESLYVRLGIALGKQGYDRLERTQPEGMPAQSGSVVYRYRRDDDQQNTLYQAGPGVFTANGLPPYNSWKEFEPVIEQGLTALLNIKAFDQSKPVELVLRYVDAFSADHLAGMNYSDFVEEVVGVRYNPTKAAIGFADRVDSVRFNASHVSEAGDKLILEVGQGRNSSNESVMVMNTSAISREFIAADVETVISQLSRLQDVLHDTFFEMISRSSDLKQRFGIGKENQG